MNMKAKHFYALNIMALSFWVLGFTTTVEFSSEWDSVAYCIGWALWGIATGAKYFGNKGVNNES